MNSIQLVYTRTVMSQQILQNSEVWRSPIVQNLLNKVNVPSLVIKFDIGFPFEKVSEEKRIIAGYASIEQIDKQNEIIPIEVLKDAWERCYEDGKIRLHLMHTNIPVGEIIDEYEDSEDVVHKTGVDDTGLYIVCQIWDNTNKANEAWDLIKRGVLRGFSIGGEALSKSTVCNGSCFNRIDKMDLHEISLVDNPANPDATFRILKRDELQKRIEWLEKFKDMIIFKDFINLVGSTAEKGEGHDVDCQVRLPSNLTVKCPHCLRLFKVEHPLKRHIHTRFYKMFQDDIEKGNLHIFTGDPEGPHDVYYPLYDLALVRSYPVKRVEMNFEEEKRVFKGLRLPCGAVQSEDAVIADRGGWDSALGRSENAGSRMTVKVKLHG